MAMAETGTAKKYVLKPRRRWLIVVVISSMLVVNLAPVGLDWWNGHRQEKLLQAEMEALRQRGEPIFPEDFAIRSQPVADEDNAALRLRAAAKAIDESHEAWQNFSRDEIEMLLPLTDTESRVIAAVREAYSPSLALLRGARAKHGVDWGVAVTRPLIEVLLPDLNEQKELANLALADVVFEHHSGRDHAALERAKDLLLMSRATAKMPFGVSHLVAIGISAMAANEIAMIAPTLRIGGSE